MTKVVGEGRLFGKLVRPASSTDRQPKLPAIALFWTIPSPIVPGFHRAKYTDQDQTLYVVEIL